MVHLVEPAFVILKPWHDVASFSSGKHHVDVFLKNGHAMKGMLNDVSVTMVAASGTRVFGYVTYGIGAMAAEDLSPDNLRPVFVLQNIGVDVTVQRSGLGRTLVASVVLHTLSMIERAELSGEQPILAIMAQAIDEDGVDFFRHIGWIQISQTNHYLFGIRVK